MSSRWRDWIQDQGSAKWKELHEIGPHKQFIVTASMVPNILGYGYISRNIIYKAWVGESILPKPDSFSQTAMNWGTKHEVDAVNTFKNNISLRMAMLKPGLIRAKKQDWMAASLDRLVLFEEGGKQYKFNLECKCPYKAKIPQKKEELAYRLLLQVQFQMYCSDLGVSVVVYWSYTEFSIWIIIRDDVLIDKIINLIEDFKESVENKDLLQSTKRVKKSLNDLLEQSRKQVIKFSKSKVATLVELVTSSKYQPVYPIKMLQAGLEEISLQNVRKELLKAEKLRTDLNLQVEDIQQTISQNEVQQKKEENKEYTQQQLDEIADYLKHNRLPDFIVTADDKVRKWRELRWVKHYGPANKDKNNEPKWQVKEVKDDLLNGGIPSERVLCDNKIVVTDEEAQDIMKHYYDDITKTANGRDQFYHKLAPVYHGITKSMIQNFLNNQETYQLHKPHFKQKLIKPIIVNEPFKYFQADLIVLKHLATHNKQNKYIMNFIDMFSKFAWSFPMKRKKAKTEKNIPNYVKDVCEKWFKALKREWQFEFNPDAKRWPVLQTDQGEFTSGEIQDFLKSKGIKQRFSRSHTPQTQGGIERFNGTLKRSIFTYLTQNRTYNWESVLESIVNNYNNTVHSTTGATPREILNRWQIGDVGFIADIRDKSHDRLRSRMNKFKRIKGATINIGDTVRIALSALYPSVRKAKQSGIGPLAKSYIQQWTSNLYIVTDKRKFWDSHIYKVTYNKKADAPHNSDWVLRTEGVGEAEKNLEEIWWNHSDLMKVNVDTLRSVSNNKDPPLVEVEPASVEDSNIVLEERKDGNIVIVPLAGIRKVPNTTAEEEKRVEQQDKEDKESNLQNSQLVSPASKQTVKRIQSVFRQYQDLTKNPLDRKQRKRKAVIRMNL
jgi:hypothetical protein